MQDFKQGEDVLVWEFEEHLARKRKFVVLYEGRYWCVDAKSHDLKLIPWNHAKPIPKPKMVPFTFDTFPHGLVFVRVPEGSRGQTVIAVLIGGVVFHKITSQYKDVVEVSFETLVAKSYEISTDNCETWRPAGLEVTE